MHTTSHISTHSLHDDLGPEPFLLRSLLAETPLLKIFSNARGGAALIHGGKGIPRLSLPYIDQPALDRLTGIFTPLCKTLCGSAKLAACPAIFGRNHRQRCVEGIFDM